MLIAQETTLADDPYIKVASSFVQLRRFIASSNVKILRHRHAHKKGDSLTLLEAKHMDYLLSLIPQDATELSTIEFDLNDYWKACGVNAADGGTYYRISADALQKLSDRSGYIQKTDPKTGQPSIVLVRFIQRVEFSEDNYRHCKVDFDPEMAPALLSLSKNYTQARRSEKFRLQSMYGHTLFDLLCSYEHLHEPLKFEICDLAERLDGVDELSTGNFRKRVVDTAVNDINKHSQEIHIVATPIKTGKKFSHFEFEIQRRSGICASVGEDPQVAAILSVRERVQEQINFQQSLAFLQSRAADSSLLDAIVDAICEVYTTKAETIRIRRVEIATAEVLFKFRQLKYEHIELVITKLCEESKKIINLQAYITTLLFSSVRDLEYGKAQKALNNAPRRNPFDRQPDKDEIEAIRRMLAEDSEPWPEADNAEGEM